MKIELQKQNSKGTSFWKIEWTDALIQLHYGTLGTDGKKSKKVYENEPEAFQVFKNKVVEKLKNGYQQKDNFVDVADFDDATFDVFLEQAAFEQAINWLSKFGDLLESSYEDKLIKVLVENKLYVDAERYVMGQLQRSKNLNVVVRQIRYLAEVNPMMCRFMIGNLPPKVETKDLVLYYKDFAIAQSKIGMLESAELTLKNIENPRIKIIYLANLLDNLIDENKQLGLLEKAIFLLESENFETIPKTALCILLSKAALTIHQEELSQKLHQQAQDLFNL